MRTDVDVVTHRRVVPVPGTAGYTVVTQHAVAFIAGGDPVAQSVLDGVVRRALDGRETAERLLGLLASAPAMRYPGLAAVVSADDAYEIVVAGGLEVVGAGPAGPGRWVAGDVPTRHIAPALDAVTIGQVRTGALAGLDDVHRGTVASDGVVVTWAREPAAGDVGGPWWTRPPDGRTVEPPPAATLVFDTGESFALTGNLVIGRAVDDGAGVVPGGDVRALSRRHARIVADGSSLSVVDLGSRNGTFVSHAHQTGWLPVAAGVPVAVAVGDLVGFADRTARIDPPCT